MNSISTKKRNPSFDHGTIYSAFELAQNKIMQNHQKNVEVSFNGFSQAMHK